MNLDDVGIVLIGEATIPDASWRLVYAYADVLVTWPTACL